jgi:hypothetical protein
MRSEDSKLDEIGLEASRPRLERALRRELARRLKGDAAAARVVLEEDEVFQHAREVLGHARNPGDVFAGVPADAGTGAARTANR